MQSISHARLHKVLQRSANVLIVAVFGYFVHLASHLLLARNLSLINYGDFSVFMTFVMIIAPLSIFGVSYLVLKYLPEYHHHADDAHEKGLLVFCLKVFCLSQVIFIALSVLTYVFFKSQEATYYYYLWIVPIYALILLLGNILRSAFHQVWSAFTTTVLFSLLFSLFLVPYFYIFHAVTPNRTALLFTLATILTLLVQFVLVGKEIRLLFNRKIASSTELKEWSIVGFHLMLSTAQMRLLINIDFLALKVLGPIQEQVAIYSAAIVVVVFLWRLTHGINIVMTPIFSRLIAEKNHLQLKKTYRHDILLRIAIILPFAILIIVFGKFILRWFGPDYDAGYGVMVILTVGAAVAGPFYGSHLHLILGKHQKQAALIIFGALVLVIGLCAFLIPKYGMWGAAVGYTIGKVVQTVIFLFVRHRNMRSKLMS